MCLYSCVREKQVLAQDTIGKHLDTVYSSNGVFAFADVVNDGHAALLSWGYDDSTPFSAKDTLQYDSLGFSQSIDEDGDFLVLRYGCGSSCSYGYIMPLSFEIPKHLYIDLVLFNGDKGLAVYQTAETGFLLTIEKLKTGEKMRLIEDFQANLRPTSSAIDLILWQNNKLIVRWFNQDAVLKQADFDISALE